MQLCGYDTEHDILLEFSQPLRLGSIAAGYIPLTGDGSQPVFPASKAGLHCSSSHRGQSVRLHQSFPSL